MIWILLSFAILLTVYCIFEGGGKFVPATALKVALSASIAVFAWVCAVSHGLKAPLVMMAAGLTLAVPADYFLQYIKSDGKRYEAGILCFAGMHICLLFSFVDRFSIHWQEFAIFALILGALLLLQSLQKWELGRQKLPLSVYTVLVVLMASKSISLGLLFPAKETFLIAAGGLCFVASDMVLGVWDYHDEKKVFLLLNRIIYFCGQLLFALSVFYYS